MTTADFNVHITDSSGIAIGDRAQVIQNIAAVYNLRSDTESLAALAPLTDRLRPIFARHDVFAGRTELLDGLGAFIAAQGTYLFLAGPSGFGKTALLAHWVRSLQAADVPVCYHFISRYDGIADEEFALNNLCQQLAFHHGLTGRLPTSTSLLRALYGKLLATSLGDDRRIVVVIDGIDEAAGWRVGPDLFPKTLPRGVSVVFSARDVAGRDWLAELELASSDVRELRLSTMNANDVAGLLRSSLDGPLGSVADDPMFVDGLLEISNGDPLYLHYLTEDMGRRGDVSPAQLRSWPKGLDRYFDRWWDEVAREANAPAVKDLLGYLLVSKGPIQRSELTAISASDNLDGWSFETALGAVRRYIIGTAEGGYSLGNTRFQEYLTTRRIGPADQAPFRRELLQFCERWRTDFSPYISRHFSEHLRDLGERDKLIGSLTDAEWYERQIEADPTGTRFLRDTDLAWTLIDEAGSATSADRLRAQMLCAITSCSVRSFSTNLPTGLVTMFVEHGIWTTSEAFNVVGETPVGPERTKFIVALIPYADDEELDRLASEISASPIDAVRTEGITRLISRLPPDRGHALLAAELEANTRSGPVSHQIVQASTLIPLLAEDKKDEAIRLSLSRARGIASRSSRITALGALLGCLTGEQRTAVIEETAAAALQQASPHSWAEFMGHLTEPERATFIDAAEDSIPDEEDRIDGLLQLFPFLGDAKRSHTADNLLDIASSTTSDRSRAEILRSVADSLSARQMTRAIAITAAISSARDRAGVMAWLIPRTTGDTQAQLTSALVSEARDSGDRDTWIAALTAVFPFLNEDDKKQAAHAALDAARYLLDRYSCAWALLGFADFMSNDARVATLRQALEMVTGTDDLSLQSRLLNGLAPLLPEDEMAPLREAFLRDIEQSAERLDNLRASRNGGAITTMSQLAETMEALQAEPGLEALATALAESSLFDPEARTNLFLSAVDMMRFPKNSARALAAAAPNLERQVWEVILPRALRLKDDESRVMAISATAAVAPITVDAASSVRQLIGELSLDAHRIIVKLAIFHTYDAQERAAIIDDAFSVAVSNREDDAPRRTEEEIDFSAFKVTSVGKSDDRLDPSPSARVLMALCEVLADIPEDEHDVLAERIRADCSQLQEPRDRALALGRLLPFLRGNGLSRAQKALLDAAEQINDPVTKAGAVAWEAMHLDEATVQYHFSDLLHHLSARTRSEFFDGLSYLVPCLFQLGGSTACDEAAAVVITAVRRWQ